MSTAVETQHIVRRIIIRNPLRFADRLIEVLPLCGQTIREAAPTDVDLASWMVLLNGKPTTEYDRLLCPSDEVVYSPKIQKSTVERVIWGTVGLFLPPFGLALAAYQFSRAAGLNEVEAAAITGFVNPFMGGAAVAGYVGYKRFLSPSTPSIGLPSLAESQEESPTYGFETIRNAVRQGTPIPLVYGQHRVGGQLIAAYIKTRNDTDTLFLLIAVSEGSISGIDRIEINGQAAANYQGITLDSRVGARTQMPMAFLGARTTAFYPVAQDVTVGGFTYTTESTNLWGFEVKVTCPNGLYWINKADGSVNNLPTPLVIQYRKVGTGSWFTIADTTIWGAQRSPIRRMFFAATPEPGQYEIKVFRSYIESSDPLVQDKITFDGVNEILGDAFTYPNTALLGVMALATGQLSGGIPTVTSMVTGIHCRVFWADGITYNYVHTTTPAWIVFDLLTNRRYGLGKFTWKRLWSTGTVSISNGSANFSLSGANVPAGVIQPGMKLDVQISVTGGYVLTVATFNAGTQTGTVTAAHTGLTASNVPFAVHQDDIDIQSFVDWAAYTEESVSFAGVTEPRASINLAIDTSQSVWDTARRIAQLGFAVLVKIGNYVYVRADKEETPVQLFTMGNIVNGSFRLTYAPLKDRHNIFTGTFRNAEKNWDEDTVSWEDPDLSTNNDQPRPLAIDMRGVTSRTQALRLLQRAQLANKLLGKILTFEVGVEALRCQPYDVIAFQHDIPQWGFGGRFAAGSTTTTLVVDDSVTIESGKTYEIMIRYADDTIVYATVTNTPGTYTVLTVSPALATAPTKYDLWAFGPVGISTKPFRILRIERTPELNARLTCMEYDARVYQDVDPQTVAPLDYSSLPRVTGPPGPVQNLRLYTLSGATQSVWVSFEPPGAIHFRAGRIYRLLENQAPIPLGESASGAFAVEGVRHGELVVVAVTSLSTTGQESTLETAPRAALVATFTVPDVTGLTWRVLDRTVILQWDAVSWHIPFVYEIRRGSSWLTGAIIGSADQSARSWEAYGEGTYWVAIRDRTGSFSPNPTSVQVINTLPVPDRNVLMEQSIPYRETGYLPFFDPELNNIFGGQIGGDLNQATHQLATVDAIVAPLTVDQVLDWDTLQVWGVKFRSLVLMDSIADVDAVPNWDAMLTGYDIVPLDEALRTNVVSIIPSVFLNGIGTVHISLAYGWTIEYAFPNNDDVANGEEIDDLPDFDGDLTRFVSVTPEIYVQPDPEQGFPLVAQPFQDGFYTGAGFAVQVRLRSTSQYVTPVLLHLHWLVTMQDRTVSAALVTVPAEGLVVTFAQPYQTPPAVMASILNPEEKDEVVISNISVSGFTLRARSQYGLYEQRVMNYQVTGV